LAIIIKCFGDDLTSNCLRTAFDDNVLVRSKHRGAKCSSQAGLIKDNGAWVIRTEYEESFPAAGWLIGFANFLSILIDGSHIIKSVNPATVGLQTR